MIIKYYSKVKLKITKIYILFDNYFKGNKYIYNIIDFIKNTLLMIFYGKAINDYNSQFYIFLLRNEGEQPDWQTAV